LAFHCWITSFSVIRGITVSLSIGPFKWMTLVLRCCYIMTAPSFSHAELTKELL
jgi:hypothetical protein